MILVFLQRRDVYQNVIEKDDHELTCVLGEDRVREALERRRRVRLAEWHHTKLKVAVMHLKSRLLLINLPHTNLVIARAQVQLREVGNTCQLIQQLVDDRQGELVLDRHQIQSPVVNAETPATILLFD